MAIFENLTKEQVAAFEGCKSKEEIAAKAKELGIEATEEEITTADNLLGVQSGELADDALDAVAGGVNKNKQETNDSGYYVTAKNNYCVCNKYETATYPRYSNTDPGQRCGSCEHCKQIGNDLCCLMLKMPK